MTKYFYIPFIILTIESLAQVSNSSEYESEIDTSSNYFLFDYIESLEDDDYNLFLDSIKSGLSKDYFSLRMSYTKTKNYSPYSIEIGERLKRMELNIDKGKYDLALQIADSTLTNNYVDINTHLYCGYLFNKLGDTVKSNYHYNMYNNLLESILQSGDGQNPETAYIVINTKEEYAFLSWFQLRFNGQKLIYKDDYAFDLMEASELESNKNYDIYFNISLATKFIENSFK